MLTEHQESRLREAVSEWDLRAETHRDRAFRSTRQGEGEIETAAALVCEYLGFREIRSILEASS